MAFSFGNSGANRAENAASGNITEGSELELIQTEALAFKSIAGDAKLRLTSAWTQPPADTASLLTIAPNKGLVAAAGPDGITIANTASVRKAFENEKTGDSDIRDFQPQLKLALPMRVSQIAFTTDEQYLIISAESGGGLAVYETQSLLQGATQTTFELATNGEALRALAPNPTTEKAELCALLTTNGNLHMANLRERQISNVLKTQVSCLSWSNKGKQLVAGLADGTIYQMTPEGEGKGEVPKPPSVSNSHVSSLHWLENNLFLTIHTTTDESSPTSVYHIIQRDKSNFTFQKMTDPVDPFGAEKAPHYSIMRLRDFPPNLQDLLIVCSTAFPDIGLLSRSKTPLTSDKPANTITSVFTTTELLDDSKRAQLPMSESFENTIAIGASLDLSSREKVYKPLPADEEIEESPGAVPGYWVLNNEGVLCAWWVIYEESIRQGTTYPGMAGADGAISVSVPATAAPPQAAAPAPAFAAPAKSAFGSSPFASNSAPTPAFGGSSALEAKSSPWGTPSATTPAASQPTFGSSAFGGAAVVSSPAPAFGQPSGLGFGQSSQLGGNKSPWATAGTTAASKGSSSSPFGQSGLASPPSAPSGGGFASFASSGGFASAASNGNANGGSIFGKPSTGSPFGAPPQGASDTAFPPPKTGSSGGGLFGSSQPFKLQSSFEADPSQRDSNEKPGTGGGGSLFGSGFGSALSDAPKEATSKEMDMGASDTPTETSAPKSLFGQQSGETKSPFGAPQATQASASPFGSAKPASASPFSPNAGTAPGTKSIFGSQSPAVPAVKSPFAQTSEIKSPFGQTSQATPAKSPFASSKPDESETPKAKNPFSAGLGAPSQASQAKNPFSLGSGATQTSSLFGQPSQPKSPLGLSVPESTTPTTTPAPSRFSFPTSNDSSTPRGNLFGPPSGSSTASVFSTAQATKSTPEIKVEEEDAPLPPESTSRSAYPLGDSSASSAATDAGGKASSKPESAPLPPDFVKPTPRSVAEDAPLPPDFVSTPKSPAAEEAPLPPDFVSTPKPAVAESAPLPPDFTTTPQTAKTETKSTGFVFEYVPTQDSSESSEEGSDVPPPRDTKRLNKVGALAKKAPQSKKVVKVPVLPESAGESELEEGSEEDAESEGSGVIVGKDTSPSVTGFTATPGFTPQSSFGGLGGKDHGVSQTPLEKPRSSLFGEMSRNAPIFPRPSATSPRSPSPVRSAIPHRMSQLNTSRSVSAPGMASQILGASKRQGMSNLTTVPSRAEEDPQLKAQRLARSRREAAETKVLEDDEDDEIQKLLMSDIEPMLKIDDFVAHTNVAPSTQETIPAQVETVYRDINSMIDTLGLNARSLASFIKGHMQAYNEDGRSKEDLESAEDWVLCEVNDLGEVIDRELAQDLADGRVHDIEDKLDVCQELVKEMSRLRSKQEDLKKLIAVRLDPDQAEISRSLPLSTEQAAQQNELRREYARFSKLLAEAEEALTLLKTRLATLDAASGKNTGNVPTVDAVLRTITKMTSMVEKRSGDVDVLENQMRKLRLSSANSREGTPVTPQRNGRSVMFSPDRAVGSPRNLRSSFMSPVASAKSTMPRKKLSGFSADEKTELTTRRAKRQAILDKLKANVLKNGVQPWPMPEDTE